MSVAEGVGAVPAALLNAKLFSNLREVAIYTHIDAPYSLYPTMMVSTLKKITWTSLDTVTTSAELLIAQLAAKCHTVGLESLFLSDF